jgi:pimeloyl-ACP methyl ester carboxylesterase
MSSIRIDLGRPRWTSIPFVECSLESLLSQAAINLHEGIAGLAGRRIEVIPRSGHWLVEERPDYLVDQLLAFFAP